MLCEHARWSDCRSRRCDAPRGPRRGRPRPLASLASCITMQLLARRALLAVGLTTSLTNTARPARAADLASTPFEWTGLYRGVAADAAPKQTGLAPPELARIIQTDLATNKYILTGDLTPSIFSDSCRFVDPNNAVNGLAKYRQALSLLFRPEESTVEDVSVSVAADGRSLVADYTARGVLKLPWRPVIDTWRGHIVYTLDGSNLIVSQVDEWNITRFDAIRQTFTPGK